MLLLLGPAGDQRPGEDLGPRDEAAAGTEAAPAELLGGDDHADVLGLAATAVAAVLLGDRQAEGAHLAETADDVFGDVVVVPVDVLGDRLQLVLGEAPEAVLHELEVVVEVPGTLLPGEPGEERRVAVGGAEAAGSVEGADLDAPGGLATEEPARQLADHVGHEGTGDLRLELAVGAVVEHPVRRLDGGGGVRQVVAEHLVDVGTASGSQVWTPSSTTRRASSTASAAAMRSAAAIVQGSEGFRRPRNPRKALASPPASGHGAAMPTARSGAAELAYEARGVGPPVLLMHAGVTDRRSWAPLIAHLGEGYLTIAYDRRGFGETSYEPEPHDPVADAVAVLDAARVDRGRCDRRVERWARSLDLALAHPERVAGLVLIGAGTRGGPEDDPTDYPAEVQALWPRTRPPRRATTWTRSIESRPTRGSTDGGPRKAG